ncbi:MAG: YbhB/YbcL family Raf kinase inhibitor-like protein [Desulfovibrio sp.]|nr:MAG: YbhB/YbcL family Raf kinase inhibitor-like protein [Desulfovibrio sp.]
MADDLTITSPDFEDRDMLDSLFSRRGGNVSPAINWSGAPAGTMSYAIICDDPDAPGRRWVHWVIYNIPATETGLAQGQPKLEVLDNGAVQGINSWDVIGYDGPQPPSGVHRYYFKVYALDTVLNLPPGASKNQLLDAMDDHILAEGQIMGKFR